MKTKNLIIEEDAAKLLEKKIKKDQLLLLNLNDGANIYSDMGSCGGEIAYQLVIIDHFDPNYDIKLENDYHIPVYISERESGMLGAGLKLKGKNGILSLVSDEGMVDSSLTFNDKTDKSNKINLINLQKI